MFKPKLYDEIAEWIVANFARGRLDEMPSQYIAEMLMDNALATWIACVLQRLPQVDQSGDLASKIQNLELLDNAHPYYRCFRAWLVIEGLRRRGKVKFDMDVLLRQVVFVNPDLRNVTKPDGGRLDGMFVEIKNGHVSFVGNDINLCESV